MRSAFSPALPDGEITKIKPEDVNLETGIIAISADVSKVREPQRITIQPNLAAWLRAYPLKKFCDSPCRTDTRWA